MTKGALIGASSSFYDSMITNEDFVQREESNMDLRWFWWWDAPTAKPTSAPTHVPSTAPTAEPTTAPTLSTCFELIPGAKSLFQLNITTGASHGGRKFQPLRCIGDYCDVYGSRVVSVQCVVVDVNRQYEIDWDCHPSGFLPPSMQVFNYSVGCQQCESRNAFYKTIGSCTLGFELKKLEEGADGRAIAVMLLTAAILLLFCWYREIFRDLNPRNVGRCCLPDGQGRYTSIVAHPVDIQVNDATAMSAGVIVFTVPDGVNPEDDL
jgi:hypothetical protein